MEKNVAGKWVVFAYGLPDHANPGEAITGDAANITANIRIDGGAANAVDDTNPTELEDGYYVFDITAAESNGDLLSIHPASSTANVQVIGVPGAVWTRPANFNAMGIESDGDLTKVNTLDGHTAQTGDSFTRLGAPAGASIAADLVVIDDFVDGVESVLGTPAGASISADLVVIAAYVDELESRLTAVRAGYLDNLNGHTAQTGDSFARIGAAGAGLTDLGGMSTGMKAEVNAEVDTAITDASLATQAGLAALNDLSLAQVLTLLTTQLTESYAADGVAPTLTQAIMMIHQRLCESDASGTTLTARQLDGATPAGTFTLDDAANPTSINRTG
jgi:hypothetical protein